MADDPIEPFGSHEIFFDGVADIHITESVFRCSLYSKQMPATDGLTRVVVARLAVPVSELPDIIQELVIAVAEATKSAIRPPFS